MKVNPVRIARDEDARRRALQTPALKKTVGSAAQRGEEFAGVSGVMKRRQAGS